MIRKKLLFASMPVDGHFNPLTGMAKHLQQLGYDVRWYTGGKYVEKARGIGIPSYSFQKAQVVNQDNLAELFPERSQIKGTVARLRFDINHTFLLRAPEFVADLIELRQEFAFDMLICDALFTGAPFIRQLLQIPVVAVGIIPLAETSKDLPPAGLGMEPSRGFLGRQKQAILRHITTNYLFKPCNDLYNRLLREHDLPTTKVFLFDAFVRSADVYLQSGVPGFEYPRSDISPNIRFVGPLQPYSPTKKPAFAHLESLKDYKKVILATQGTVERDPEKLLVPTLEAFANTDYLVIATTGGSQTAELRARFPQANVIIEDFIDFNVVMPYADVFVTNGGYGGVLRSIQHGLPIVAAGIHEGKSEINARINYFKLGINLKTETPTPKQIARGVEKVLEDPLYGQNMARLRTEFKIYDPNRLCAKYVSELFYDQADRPISECKPTGKRPS